MKDFALILRANNAMNGIPTPQDLEERMAWLTEIEAKGIMSQKGGAMPAKPDAMAQVFADGTEVDGFDKDAAHFNVGLLVIKAADMQEAKAIAKSNPIVKAGGSVEVREIILR